jgi:hypothetical protein
MKNRVIAKTTPDTDFPDTLFTIATLCTIPSRNLRFDGGTAEASAHHASVQLVVLFLLALLSCDAHGLSSPSSV